MFFELQWKQIFYSYTLKCCKGSNNRSFYTFYLSFWPLSRFFNFSFVRVTSVVFTFVFPRWTMCVVLNSFGINFATNLPFSFLTSLYSCPTAVLLTLRTRITSFLTFRTRFFGSTTRLTFSTPCNALEFLPLISLFFWGYAVVFYDFANFFFCNISLFWLCCFWNNNCVAVIFFIQIVRFFLRLFSCGKRFCVCSCPFPTVITIIKACSKYLQHHCPQTILQLSQ